YKIGAIKGSPFGEVNCSLYYWRGSAQRLPLGEAVTKNGSSEPVLVTDEGQPETSFTEQL
ncbi:MAG: hypothetical protein UHS47_13540, partial [Oscillospiraceae bacterium]|nr:hypothetical protein [Oscillospiraceae bacterium]